jgi:hypothetical protein
MAAPHSGPPGFDPGDLHPPADRRHGRSIAGAGHARHAPIHPPPAGAGARAAAAPGAAQGIGPGRLPRVRAPGARPAGRGWGDVGHACTRDAPKGWVGASRVRTRHVPHGDEGGVPGSPIDAMPRGEPRGLSRDRGGWRPGETRGRLPPPMPDCREPCRRPGGPIRSMACRRGSAVILRRQRAPPGQGTIRDGFRFHKADALVIWIASRRIAHVLVITTPYTAAMHGDAASPAMGQGID